MGIGLKNAFADDEDIFGQRARAKLRGIDRAERADMVRKLATGDDSWTLKKWELAWAGNLSQPSSLKITLSDPTDLVDSEYLYLVWRSADPDAVDYVEAKPLMTVREGATYAVLIDEIKGERLEIWISDSVAVSVQVESATKFAEHQAKATTSQAEEKSGTFAKLKTSGTGKWVLGGLAIVAAAAVVYGIVATPGALGNVAEAV